MVHKREMSKEHEEESFLKSNLKSKKVSSSGILQGTHVASLK